MSASVQNAIIEDSDGDARSAITRVQMIATNRNTRTGDSSDARQAMDAQATLANIQSKDVSQSIFQLVDFTLKGRTEKEIQKAEAGASN